MQLRPHVYPRLCFLPFFLKEQLIHSGYDNLNDHVNRYHQQNPYNSAKILSHQNQNNDRNGVDCQLFAEDIRTNQVILNLLGGQNDNKRPDRRPGDWMNLIITIGIEERIAR